MNFGYYGLIGAPTQSVINGPYLDGNELCAMPT